MFEVWLFAVFLVPAYMSMESHQKGLQAGKQNISLILSSEMCTHKMLNTLTTTISNLAFLIVSINEYVYSPLSPPHLPHPPGVGQKIGKLF